MSQQKSILITGCSQGGIGDELAQEFHRKGLKVFATARSLNKMAHLTSMGIETMTLEVTSATSIAEAVAKISAKTGGKLDYLVNNSGSGYNMPVTDIDLEEAKKIFDVNFFGVIAVTQAFMPLLLKSHGTVVNNTSIVSVAPLPFLGIYNASKAAAHSISHNMRLELEPLGIKVLEIMSGKVSSKFFVNANVDATGGIPQSSYYRAAKKEVESVMSGRTAKGTEMDTMQGDVFAKKVVKDVLKSSPPSEIWRGASASLVWLSTCFPVGWQDAVLRKVSDFGAVTSKLV